MKSIAFHEWHDTSPALKRFSFWSLSLGVALTVICVAVDIEGHWDRLPFLTSLMSGITGALFGLPVGLIILSRLSAHQAEWTGRSRTERQLREAVEDLKRVAYSLVSPTRNPDDNYSYFEELQKLAILESRLRQEVESSSTAEQGEKLQPGSPLQVAAQEYAEARSRLML